MDMMNKQKWVRMLTFLILSLFCIFLLYFTGGPTSYVWVMDAGDVLNETHLIKMCPTGKRLLQTQFGQSGGIGIDLERNILWAPELNYLNQIYYDQVVQVDQEGKIIDRFQGYRMNVLAVDPADGSIWVNAWDAYGQRTLMTKLASNGKLLRRVEGFSQVYSVAINPRDSSLWVADGVNRTITHLTADGEKLFEMRTAGFFFSNAPHQVAVDPRNGDVWFTTVDPSSLHKLSSGGEGLPEISGLRSPVAVTINPMNGNVWVADYDLLDSGAIVKFDPQGELILTQALPAHVLTAAINPFDGMLWVGMDGEMIRYYDDGSVAGREIGFNQPQSIAFAKTGNNFLTEIKCTLSFYPNLLK
jgi:DNA-binding beta-propeller fold protein YncE